VKSRKICVLTGTRAEYGLLYWLMKKIQQDEQFQLQLLVTGMHLSPEFGLTYKAIEEDGFIIDGKVEMLLSSDTPIGIAKSMGLAAIGFADQFARLNPDLLIILGDRFELLSAAQTALVFRIPIAHLCGGDTTEGAFDESIRHSITKMSHLHFVTTSECYNRVLQMGENPNSIFKVGYPGLDYINHMDFMSKDRLSRELGVKFRKKNLLITFHSVTLENATADVQCQELLAALDTLGSDHSLFFTMPNADTYGRGIMKQIQQFVADRSNAYAFTSLGQKRYLSMFKHVDMVIGNSSSGLSEAPSFRIPTVNIGDRQKGRLQAESVINSQPNKDDIVASIQKAFTLDCSNVVNPYGDGYSSERILQHLKSIPDYNQLLKKHFFER
jgi:UDP-hydrolysing UDP-N-acetyl-D-glucosamine 2-epimerase